ncbi:MAG: hypothetical protein LBO02_01375 [Holosporaceae bacterium]|jgi:hypothetical protein|nr:hypothetical protein [Holosporaceae bacterium]
MRLKRYKFEIILILTGLLASFLCYARTHFFAIFFGDFNIRFFDTDDYMTIVRIRDFFRHYDLANSVIARANVPFGGDMHWTRFYDFFLIVPSFILNLFLDSIDQATEYVGLLISPAVKCVSVILLFDLFQKIMTKRTAFLASLIFAVQPVINYINMFGRPDHHAFIMLFIIIYAHNIARLCQSGFSDYRSARNAAVTAALCVWISPETLIFLLLSEAVMFLCFYSDIEKLMVLYRKNVISACVVGIIVFLFCKIDVADALCVGALSLISYLTIKEYRPWHVAAFMLLAAAFSTLPAVEYDKISVVHVGLYMCIAVFFGCAPLYCGKITYSIAAGCAVKLAFLFMFPKFLQGMEADLGETLKAIWLDAEVDELKSPYSFGKMPSLFFSIYMLISSVAIYNKIHDLTSKKFENMDATWWIFVVACSCYQILAIMADRMRPAYSLMGIPLIVDLAMNGAPLKFAPNSLKIAMACFLTLTVDMSQKYGYILKTYFANWSELRQFCEEKKEAYRQEDRFFKFLDGLEAKPTVILTYLGKSTMTLYYTKHKVVAVPYHRQGQGILSFFTVIESDYDENKVKQILLTTNTSYIFISKTMCYATPSARNSLAGMIVRGNVPDWIDVVKLPDEFEDVILVKINQNKLLMPRISLDGA